MPDTLACRRNHVPNWHSRRKDCLGASAFGKPMGYSIGETQLSAPATPTFCTAAPPTRLGRKRSIGVTPLSLCASEPSSCRHVRWVYPEPCRPCVLCPVRPACAPLFSILEHDSGLEIAHADEEAMLQPSILIALDFLVFLRARPYFAFARRFIPDRQGRVITCWVFTDRTDTRSSSADSVSGNSLATWLGIRHMAGFQMHTSRNP